MAEAVAGAAIGATIKVVLQNLLSASIEEISLVLGFKNDLQRLKDSFIMIQDFLSDAEEKQMKNKAVKRWLKNLEAVALDADDVLDEINYQLLRQKVNNQNNKMKKVQSFFSGLNGFAFRIRMGHKIKGINKSLKKINQEAMEYGLQQGVMDANAPVAESLEQTASFTNDPIVGREHDVSKIVNMLINCSMEQCFTVIPIVAMGGMGKTTLAQRVFKDGEIDTKFKKKIWVYVREKFDAITVFKSILELLIVEKVDLETKEAILKMLQLNLQDERYLLVIDNVWNVEERDWDDFLTSLEGINSLKGNGIIITTRSKEVAFTVGAHTIHELSGLTDDQCWSVIKKEIF